MLDTLHPLVWTDEKPVEEGWYWWRRAPYDTPEMTMLVCPDANYEGDLLRYLP